jgi:hypothetical protein
VDNDKTCAGRTLGERTHGTVTEQRVPRIRTNQELRELYKSSSSVVDIKIRLGLLAHVTRIDDRREGKEFV